MNTMSSTSIPTNTERRCLLLLCLMSIILTGTGSLTTPVLANVLVNQDVPPRQQNSPSIIFDQISGNLVSAYVDDPFGANGIGTSLCPIGTTNWQDSQMQIPTVFGVEVDPFITSDQAGLVYGAFASYDMLPATSSGIFIHASLDGGVTFQGLPMPVWTATGPIGGIPLSFKPKIEADASPVSPFHRNVHCVWEMDNMNGINSDAAFASAPPPGVTWTPPIPMNDSPGQDLVLWPDLAVASNGDIHAAWLETPFNAQAFGFPGVIKTDASFNGGTSFRADVTAVNFWTVPGMLTEASGAPKYNATSYPSIAVDPGNPARVGMAYAARPGSGILIDQRLDQVAAGSNDTSRGSIFHSGSRIATDNGIVHTVWDDDRSGTWEIYYRQTQANNPTWASPEVLLSNISGPNHPGSQLPVIAASGNNVVVVWQELGGSNYIYITCSNDGGQTWSAAPIGLDNAATSQGASCPQVVINGINIVVTWEASVAPIPAVQIRSNSSFDGGLNWGGEQIISTSPYFSQHDVALVNNNVYVTWTDAQTTTSTAQLWCATSVNNGTSWAAPVQVDSAPPGTWAIWGAKVCGNGNDVYICWVDDRQGWQDLYFNRSINNGFTWGTDVCITPTGYYNSRYQQVACSGSNIYVVYSSSQATPYSDDIYFTFSSDGGLTWPANQTSRLNTGVPVSTRQMVSPRLSVTGPRIYVTWMDDRNGPGFSGFDIYGTHSTNGGVTWPLSDYRLDVGDAPGANDSQYPHIAADAGGNCFYYWRDTRHGTGTIGDPYTTAMFMSNDEADVFYTESTDGGLTWNFVIRVNDDLTTTDQSHPWVDIKPNGTVDVTWLDSRNCPFDRDYDSYFAALLPGMVAFQPNQRVSNQLLPAPPTMNWIGDYVGIDVDATMGHLVWPDTRNVPDMGLGDIYYDSVMNPGVSMDGACCYPAGNCLVSLQDDCLAGGGNFLGEGVQCDPNPCPYNSYLDHEVGNCRLTMTDQGSLGFLTQAQTEGSGFVYPVDGENLLYLGGPWAGCDSSYIANRDFDNDPALEWRATDDPSGHIVDEGEGESDQDLVARFTDVGAAGCLNLEVQQESWAWSYPTGADDFVIINYRVENVSETLLEDLYFGEFMDFDIGDPITNEGVSDLAAGMVCMFEAASGLHAGLVLLDHDGYPPVANMSLIHNPTYIWPDGFMQNGDKFGFLSGNAPEYQVMNSDVPDDYSMIASVGPFHLLPHEVVEFSFAVVGGESLEAFMQNVHVARVVFNGGASSVDDETDSGLALVGATHLLPHNPNPFMRGSNATIRYELAAAAEVQLDVFDVNGRLVRNLMNGQQLPGNYGVVWDGSSDGGRSLAGGVYYVRLRSGNTLESRTIIILN
jgi:FlgD Ig-like domain